LSVICGAIDGVHAGDIVRRIVLLLFLTLAVTGCESDPHAVFASPEAITAPILGLKGGSIDHAIDYLGLPDSEIKLDAGNRVVVWNGQANPAGPNNRSTKAAAYCRIKATVGVDNTVSSVEIDANSAFYCPRGKR
jgi:hypothetical protein